MTTKKVIFKNITKEKDSKYVHYIDNKYIGRDFGGFGNYNNRKFSAATTKNRFYHTLWTKPMLSLDDKARWGINFQYYLSLPLAALSIALLKKHGQEVSLYTDMMGERLLKDLPYDNIYRNMDDTNVHVKMWAAAKIDALEVADLDEIQIDTDVFIYDGSIIDNCHRSDIICSHLEKTNMYRELVNESTKIFKTLDGYDKTMSANCGLVKINNEDKKYKYIDWYQSACKRLDWDDELRDRLYKFTYDGSFPIDLITEQYAFYTLCNPIPVFSGSEEDRVNGGGFIHPLGFEKYINIQSILTILKLDFPKYYNIVMKTWKRLDFKVLSE